MSNTKSRIYHRITKFQPVHLAGKLKITIAVLPPCCHINEILNKKLNMLVPSCTHLHNTQRIEYEFLMNWFAYARCPFLY